MAGTSSDNPATQTPVTPNPALVPREQEDPYSPYYLHHSENSVFGAITPILDKNNFHTWSKAFLMSLLIRNKVGFVNGTITKPEKDDEKMKSWQRCNTIILSWLIHSVSPEIRSTILYMETAQECWEKLKVLYAQPNDVRIYQLQQELSSITQGNGSVTDFFTKLTSLWEELGHYRPTPSCSCNQCKCKYTELQEKAQDTDKIFKFLMGLSDAYDMIRG